MTLTISDHALRYASYGWRVIPVMGKRPVGEEWQKRASSDQATVARLFAKSAHDGVGVLIGQQSGLIDFDCDSETAEFTLQRLFDGNIPKTPSFQSTRGRHVLFRWTNELPSGSIKLVIDGLEIRLGNDDKGCQSVFPPSGERVWIVDPDSCELAEIPPEVIERINARHSESRKPKTFVPVAHEFADSTNDDRLNVPKWLAKHGRAIIGTSESGDVTRWHIECPNVERHTTQNGIRDCCVTQDASGKLGGCCLHSSCGMRDWSTLHAAIGRLEYSDYHDCDLMNTVDLSGLTTTTHTEKPQPQSPIDPNAMTDEFYKIPGLIGDLVEYHKQYAHRPQPGISLLGSIALVGTIAGRKIQTESGLRSNIYCIGLAPSGSGKERPRAENIKALSQAGCPQFLGAENPCSDAALTSELEDNPALLLQIDEVAKYFSTIRSTTGNTSHHLKAILSKFLELTGASENPIWMPKSWADKKRKIVIAYPHLCIFGVSTVEGFWNCVTSADAADGFLGRMMVIEGVQHHPRLRSVQRSPIPQSVVDVIKDWAAFTPPGGGNISDLFPDAMIVPTDSAAAERLHAHSEGIEDQLPHDPKEQRPIWARCAALAGKLAMIYAASRGPSGLIIKLEDAEAAVRQANWSTRLVVNRLFNVVSDSEEERQKKKLFNVIRENGPITLNFLTRKSQWVDAYKREGMLKDLILANMIERSVSAPSTKGGVGSIVFRSLT